MLQVKETETLSEPPEPPDQRVRQTLSTPLSTLEPTRHSQPKQTPRPELWADIPDEKWFDWRWQLAHRLNTLEELSQIIHLTPEEIQG